MCPAIQQGDTCSLSVSQFLHNCKWYCVHNIVSHIHLHTVPPLHCRSPSSSLFYIALFFISSLNVIFPTCLNYPNIPLFIITCKKKKEKATILDVDTAITMDKHT